VGDAVIVDRPVQVLWAPGRRAVLEQLDIGVAHAEHHQTAGAALEIGDPVADIPPSLPVPFAQHLETNQVPIEVKSTIQVGRTGSV
jgi:hypothetical protein